MTYEGTIQEGEGSVWEDTSDEECDEPSSSVKDNKEMSFPRTKPKVVPRHSLLTEQMHGNDGGSAMQNVASSSSPESRRPRTPDGSRPTSPSSMRRNMISRETTRSLRKEMLRERRASSGQGMPRGSREIFGADFPDYPRKGRNP